MRATALILALLLTACGESPFEAAERQYEFQKANRASEADLCAAAKKVAAAAMEQGDSMQFKLWTTTGEIHCLASGAPDLDAEAKADELERMAEGATNSPE